MRSFFCHSSGEKRTKEGSAINEPIDDYNHLMDALRYSLEDVRLGGVKFNRDRFNL